VGCGGCSACCASCRASFGPRHTDSSPATGTAGSGAGTAVACRLRRRRPGFCPEHRSVPIYLNWRNRHRRRGEYTEPANAPWSLGRWGVALNVIAILWVVFIVVVFALPPNELVLWTMLSLAIALAAYWRVSARRHFAGPKSHPSGSARAASDRQPSPAAAAVDRGTLVCYGAHRGGAAAGAARGRVRAKSDAPAGAR